MTQGQIIFLSGFVLLIITVALAIIFSIKKPRYWPDQFDMTDNETTPRFRNGYPTDRLTKRYPPASETPAQSSVPEEETEHIQDSGELSELDEETEPISSSTGLEEATAKLQKTSDFDEKKDCSRKTDFLEGAEPLQVLADPSENTECLTEATGLSEATESLQETGSLTTQAKPLGEETENLNEDS